VWTQIEGDPQNYTSDSLTITYLADALQYQVFDGAAMVQGSIQGILLNDEDISDSTKSVAVALFGPNLDAANDLPSSMTAFQDLLNNLTGAMTNAYASSLRDLRIERMLIEA